MTDEEEEKYAKEIYGRIELETAQRTYEKSQRLIQMENDRAEDISKYNDIYGVHSKYKIIGEDLEEEFSLKRQIDNDRFQGYWDQLSDGTYKRQTFDKERQQKIKSATNLVKHIMQDGGQITDNIRKTLKTEYGEDVMEMVHLTLKKEENQRLEELEQKRIKEQRENKQRLSDQLREKRKEQQLENGHEITQYWSQ